MKTRSPRRDAILRQVDAQGVQRPFGILVRMPEPSRLELGRLLGCRVQPGDLPEAQAWRLINENIRGLQARTHWVHEMLSPFARNNNWWEIVTRTASALGLRFYPGLKDEEVERLLFDHLAAEYLRGDGNACGDPDRFLGELHPNLGRAIASLGLSPTGRHALLVTLLRAAAAEPIGPAHRRALPTDSSDPREGHNRIADWLRKAMPWTWATSIPTGLRLLHQRLGCVCHAFARACRRPGNYGKVAAALSVIWLYDLVERTAEQFDVVGG